MRWRQVDDWYLESEGGRFRITKANVTGWLCYALFDMHDKDKRGNPRTIGFERGISPYNNDQRLAAVNKLKAIADEREPGPQPDHA